MISVDESNMINSIILYNYSDSLEFWFIELFPSKKPNLKKMIFISREIKRRQKKIKQLYNWLKKRYFINKCKKICEYYWRPGNYGYYEAKNNFEITYINYIV